jgi:DNA-binding phage protein
MDRNDWEYRIDWGPGYRLYLGRDGEALIILLVGGTKRRQQADIERAKALFAEYKSRKVATAAPRHRDSKMALTRDFKETVSARVSRDPAFAKALLDEAATLFLNGDPHAARLMLRDLVNASVGFEALAAETKTPSKSLHRMLSERGNPSMDNLAAIFGVVRKRLGVDIRAHAVKAA